MINWMYFPQNKEIEDHLKKVIRVFEEKATLIDSEHNRLKSDDVLSQLCNGLLKEGYRVEKSKKKEDKIRVPVLYGKNGKENLAFEVDAYSEETDTIIEVEAGRAVTNYQFLKDFFEVCMIQSVKFFCIAVRNTYYGTNDFEKVCSFFQTMYISDNLDVPLEGILVIGY